MTNKYVIFKKKSPRRILRMLLIFLKREELNESKELRPCFPQIQMNKQLKIIKMTSKTVIS